MNRQRAKELLPVIQAFAEGKTIESRYIKTGMAFTENRIPSFSDDFEYRIKPEPKYRPFVDKEECWNEMLKHQPFGWVKAYYGQFVITEIRDSKATIGRNDRLLDFDYIFSNYKFADGTPFGIKE
nr:MAG: hypothetical protein [Bacteriophage sp.]UWG27061.1 MAG: hypothetical protein [Bacteriophage sp.]